MYIHCHTVIPITIHVHKHNDSFHLFVRLREPNEGNNGTEGITSAHGIYKEIHVLYVHIYIIYIKL